jgi:BioD-like phosphotransacetylase family protein
MPVLLIASLRPLVGKTAVSVAVARRLERDGHSVRLFRLAAPEPDAAAQADASCFAALSLSAGKGIAPVSLDQVAGVVKGSRSPADVFIVELPAGFPLAEVVRTLDGAALLVERSAHLTVGKVAALQQELGQAFAGLVLTTVPRAQTAAIADTLAQKGIRNLALLPEDRLLSSPTIGEVAQALQAEAVFADGCTEEVVERLTIASISADPGQAYFARFGRQAVVVRCDKPDLQLAALNAGSRCLILSGGRMPLAYVSERAEAEGVPLLITDKGTVAACEALEDLFLKSRFGPQKAERIGQLAAEELDYDGLLQALGLRPKGPSGS